MKSSVRLRTWESMCQHREYGRVMPEFRLTLKSDKSCIVENFHFDFVIRSIPFLELGLNPRQVDIGSPSIRHEVEAEALSNEISLPS